jgi:hypothetical protein
MNKNVVSAAAIRQRRHREDARRGIVTVLVKVDGVRLAAMLSDPNIENNFLAHDDPSREQLADAISRFLEAYVTRYEDDKFGTLD